jgi:hypothetical protein
MPCLQERLPKTYSLSVLQPARQQAIKSNEREEKRDMSMNE